MKVKVIKGTNQIGGCITEIVSDEARIIIDFGLDLDDGIIDDKEDLLEIEGLTIGRSSYDAVFITHSHSDHIGLIHKINKDIPIYIEENSKRIYELTNVFTNNEIPIVKTNIFKFNKPIIIKDMIITPYLNDHSAYNSAMFLIESSVKRILHTGDYRESGRKSYYLKKTIEKIGKINSLITEGTSFSRDDIETKEEWQLEIDASEIFKKYNQVFILQSSTNIDRLVSFYKASTRTGKNFIEDLFTATITLPLNLTIPKPGEFNNVSVWIPRKYNFKSKDFKEKYIKPLEKYKNPQVLKRDYTMMIKTSMLEDIKMLYDKGYITNACLVYSMWEGYKEQKEMKKFLESIEDLGIKIISLHTSGHADIKAMKHLEEHLKPDIVIPIHTNKKEKSKEIFKNARILEDNEELEI